MRKMKQVTEAFTKATILIILIALTVSFSLFKYGGILFTLDFVIGEKYVKRLINLFYGFDTTIWGAILIWRLINTVFIWIFGTKFAQYALLTLILATSGISMYRLVSSLPLSEYSKLYASILYMINPYTYIRLLVGHWYIIFAYAFLPLAIKKFYEVLESKYKRKLVEFAFLMSFVSVSSHILLISVIIFAVILIYNRSMYKIKNALISFILFLCINLYWLIPAITEHGGKNILSGISNADIVNFSPQVESFSIFFTLASMHGFWRDGYIYSKDLIPFWQVIFLIILFIAIYGFTCGLRCVYLKKYVKIFIVIWIVGLFLSSGVMGPFSEIFKYLFDKLQFFRGMRDTHKFVAMIVLSYSYLGAIGIHYIGKSIKKKYIRIIITCIFLMAPIVYSYTFFNGFSGQLTPGNYPDDWYMVNRFLNNDTDDFAILFLPWHFYMDFKWVKNTDKRISNPSQSFFDKPVIFAKNVELPGKLMQFDTPVQRYIINLLENNTTIDNFGELVSVINVKYVLLTKEADYKKYYFLFSQKDLKLVLETDNFYVFKNTKYISRIYTTDKSDELDYMHANKVKYIKLSNVKYNIHNVSGKYLIFTNEYSTYWELNGIKPLKAYGVVNAWNTDNIKNGEITYGRFYKIHMPSYILSLITMLLAFFMLLRR